MAGRKGLKTVLLHRIAAFLIFRELAEETTEILSFFLAYPGFLECICNKSGNSENAFSYGERFDYDPNGNRMRKELTLVRTFTDSSQYYPNTEWLMTDGEYAYKYDPAGNMTEKGNRYTIDGDEVTFTETSGEGVEYWQYEFDLLNRLVAVTKNGVLIREYRYGPDGLRTVSVNHMTGETMHYQYQGDNLVFEKNITTDKIKSYIFAFGKHLARVDGTPDDETADRYYYHTDHVGSVRAITDDNGDLVWEGEYSSFGVLIQENRIDETFSDHIRFGGKLWDEETGLYYFNARYYDASTGRFISSDPVQDGLNWYVYSANNPLRFVDKTGLNWDTFGDEEDTEENNNYGDDEESETDINDPPPEMIADLIILQLLSPEANRMTIDEINQYLENRRNARSHHPEDGLWSYGWFGGIEYCGGVVGDENVTHLTFRQNPLDSVDAAYKEHDWGGFIETGKFHDFFSDESLKSDYKLVSDLTKIIESGVVFDSASKKPLPNALNREAIGVASDSLTFFRDILIPYKTEVKAMQSIPEIVEITVTEQLIELYELFRKGGGY